MAENYASGSLLTKRKSLPHSVPEWLKSGSLYFITICCRPRGVNQLCQPESSPAIFSSIRRRQTNHEWFARLVLLMPDHLHALISFPSHGKMTGIMRSWKRYLARQHGIRWQRDFFDHRIRNDASWEEKAYYIRRNPVRKGLVAEAKDWVYVWQPDED